MLSTFSATKLAVFLGSILLTFFMVAHFPADAGRTEFDEHTHTSIVYDCDGNKCSQSTIYTTTTVHNSHWNSYHKPPNQSGHTHGSSVRNTTVSASVTHMNTERCDGTSCGSGSGGGGGDG